MAASDTVRNAGRLVTHHGEAMTLKREGEASTITLRGKRVPGTVADIGGSAAQQEFRVKIGTTELAASPWASKAPVRHDSIVIDGRERAILDVRPLGDAGAVALYELAVAG
mgnify:FL=1|jgi:hypothetical protein